MPTIKVVKVKFLSNKTIITFELQENTIYFNLLCCTFLLHSINLLIFYCLKKVIKDARDTRENRARRGNILVHIFEIFARFLIFFLFEIFPIQAKISRFKAI